MLPIWDGPVRSINHRYQIVNDNLFEGSVVLKPPRRARHRRCSRSLVIAALHHNDHWSRLTGGNEIVEDKLSPTLVRPTRFVLAGPVLQNEHGIAGSGVVIPRRGVHNRAAPRTGSF